jgi:hypothetical protein
MKLRKVLSLIVAIAMVCAFATTSSATGNFKIDAGKEFTEMYFAGDGAGPGNKICHSIIRQVRFTLDIPNHSCGPTEDDPDGEACNGECITVVAFGGPIGWSAGENKFCYAKTKTLTVNLNDKGWNNGETEGVGYFLKVAAATWVEGNGTVKVDVLGEGGKVLALADGCEHEGCTGSRKCGQVAGAVVTGTGTGSTGSDGDKDLDTGVTGVAILGAVAVLAAGTVVATRRRK